MLNVEKEKNKTIYQNPEVEISQSLYKFGRDPS